jgi:hypothetical protein
VRHYYLGVDIAGEANTWVAALVPSDGDLEIAFAPKALNSQELIDLVAREEPTAVAIDGQLSLAFSDGNGHPSDACRQLTSRWCESNRIRRHDNIDCDGALDALVCATVAHCFHHAPERLRLLRHTAADRQGRGPFVVFNARGSITSPKAATAVSMLSTVDQAATTDSSPCSLRVGRTVICTSWPRLVRKFISRSIEYSPDRPFIRRDTLGC